MFNHFIKTFTVISILLVSLVSAQNLQELMQMKEEFEQLKNSRNQLDQYQNNNDISSQNLQQVTMTPYEKGDDTTQVKTRHYGYDFFSRRDTVSFWESLPAPSNYILGPGDELVVSIWGETQLQNAYQISRDGKIYDEKVGQLYVMGKNLQETKKYLIDQFGRVYSTLRGQSPSTFMDISLGQLRSINVNFVGEVNYPGLYPVHPFSTLITGIIQAGGIDTIGTLRNIQIKRAGEETIEFDFYNYLLNGENNKNIQLRNDDVIFVPVRKTIVKVDSAVYRPGYYESRPGETIKDLIQYAGGLKSTSSSTIDLKRTIPIEDRGSSIVHEKLYIDYKNSHLYEVRNGDIINVKEVFYAKKYVEILGQVKNPGLYNFFDNMKILDLINLSGGLDDTTFLKSVYLNQAELIRRDPLSRYEDVIHIDLRELIDGEESSNIALYNLDKIVIHENINYFEKRNVKIFGEVKIPGRYPILKDEETLESFLNRAGGLTSKAFEEGIEIFRDSLRVAWTNKNIFLSPGDSVVVKEKPGVIFVTGQVYNSGLIEFEKNKSMNYYIDAAGGINRLGDKRNISVIYANGTIKPKKFLSTPKIRDGAIIVVNQKPPSEPFDPTEFANTTLSLVSSFVTIIVLLRQS